MTGPTTKQRGLALSPVGFVVALGVYVLLGVMLRTYVLNWIVGPLFPLLVLYLLPRGLRRAHRRREAPR